MNKNIYWGMFDSKNDVERNFDIQLDNENILFAEYVSGDYSGNAWVVFEHNGELFEVHGSHCSCNGLEGQWSPESTSAEEILFRLERNGHNEFNTPTLKEIMKNYMNALEDLPSAKELVRKILVNVENLIKEENVLLDQKSQLRSFNKFIVEQIKENVSQKNGTFEIKFPLQLSEDAKELSTQNLKNKNTIEQEIARLVEPSEKTLNDKGYKCNMKIKNNSILVEIEIEELKNKSTKKTKRQI